MRSFDFSVFRFWVFLHLANRPGRLQVKKDKKSKKHKKANRDQAKQEAQEVAKVQEVVITQVRFLKRGLPNVKHNPHVCMDIFACSFGWADVVWIIKVVPEGDATRLRARGKGKDQLQFET